MRNYRSADVLSGADRVECKAENRMFTVPAYRILLGQELNKERENPQRHRLTLARAGYSLVGISSPGSRGIGLLSF